MIARFLRNEIPFILALLVMLLLIPLSNTPVIESSLLLEGIVFLVIFAVIIYAAMGVVHHAELLAHKFGEPYGTMILTFSAVTVEIIMISAMMLHGDADPFIARDTIFSTLMILLNGLTGLIMLLGGLRYGEQKYNIRSTNSFFSMIFGLVGVGLLLPLVINAGNYHIFEYFLISVCLLLYIFFLRMQSKEHNFYFKFEKLSAKEKRGHDEGTDPKKISGLYHTLMLVLTIIVISIMAEDLSVYVDDGISKLGVPSGIAGLIIALIIVSPEGLTAIRAGLKDDMQRVINISLGSMLSTVALTIPAVLIVGLFIKQDVSLGLTPVQSVMVVISLLIGIQSCKDGESNALQGFIHFMLFITFVFLLFI
ncbi:MAG: calcium:proton antiporter [Ignavibacteria bacterium]|nr:calcium:proton antiporter [Ignavibacteria bacterium]